MSITSYLRAADMTLMILHLLTLVVSAVTTFIHLNICEKIVFDVHNVGSFVDTTALVCGYITDKVYVATKMLGSPSLHSILLHLS